MAKRLQFSLLWMNPVNFSPRVTLLMLTVLHESGQKTLLSLSGWRDEDVDEEPSERNVRNRNFITKSCLQLLFLVHDGALRAWPFMQQPLVP